MTFDSSLRTLFPTSKAVIPEFLDSKIDSIASLCKSHRVTRLDAFGSVLRDDFDHESDVDFLVSFERGDGIDAFRQYFDFKEALEALLGRNVDLVCSNAIRNAVFRAEVEATREPLYAA